MEAQLKINIKKATNLLAKDNINLGIKKIKGKSDPYVEIQFGDRWKRTEVIAKDLNPVWNQEIIMPLPQPPPELLKLCVFDHDMIGTDESLGEVTVFLNEVIKEKMRKVDKIENKL